MAVSKAQQKAVYKYKKANYDKFDLRFPKGEKEVYTDRVKLLGYNSFNQFVVDAINEKLDREE